MYRKYNTFKGILVILLVILIGLICEISTYAADLDQKSVEAQFNKGYKQAIASQEAIKEQEATKEYSMRSGIVPYNKAGFKRTIYKQLPSIVSIRLMEDPEGDFYTYLMTYTNDYREMYFYILNEKGGREYLKNLEKWGWKEVKGKKSSDLGSFKYTKRGENNDIYVQSSVHGDETLFATTLPTYKIGGTFEYKLRVDMRSMAQKHLFKAIVMRSNYVGDYIYNSLDW